MIKIAPEPKRNDKSAQVVTVNPIIVTQRKRGRPVTGAALTNAERQKAYRERRKARP